MIKYKVQIEINLPDELRNTRSIILMEDTMQQTKFYV